MEDRFGVVVVGVTRLPRIQQRRSLLECFRRLDRKGHTVVGIMFLMKACIEYSGHVYIEPSLS